MRKTRQNVGKDLLLFFFTTFDDLIANDPLNSAIWQEVGLEEPTMLFSIDHLLKVINN